ncbi:XkdX family protein [Paenibacillus senegalensis]|nr:XkdX family protein [Paenibacillus senegalensis]
MDWFAIIKRHYTEGRYKEADVAVFVDAGKITKRQYKQITGVRY